MAYPSWTPAKIPVRLSWIPSGDLGTIATLHAMRHAARVAAPSLTPIARTIVGGTSDATAQAFLLRAWLAEHTRFKADPAWVELVRTPLQQLKRIAVNGVMPGDCDDVATLGAALALAVGLRTRYVVLGFQGASGPFRHVYTEVRTPQGWRDFDVTRNPSTPHAARLAAMEV